MSVNLPTALIVQNIYIFVELAWACLGGLQYIPLYGSETITYIQL